MNLIIAKFPQEWLDIYFNLFNVRIHYGIRDRDKNYLRRPYKANSKLPKILHNNEIITALEHKGNRQYCVSFNNNYDKELKEYLPTCLYALLDIDDTSKYFNNLAEIDRVFAKYGIRIIWYKSTINSDGSFNGWHGYVFFNEYQHYHKVAGAFQKICDDNGLITIEGRNKHIELFPNVRSETVSIKNKNDEEKKYTLPLMHRLPCQEGFGATLFEFCRDTGKKSEITKEKIDELACKFYKDRKCKRGKQPSKYSREKVKSFVDNLAWTGSGQTQDNVYLTAYFYRKELGLERAELFDLVYEKVINAPNFNKYSKHTHEIQKIINYKLDHIFDTAKVQPGWQVKIYTKRINNTENIIKKIKQAIKEGATNCSQISQATGLAYSTVNKYCKNDNSLLELMHKMKEKKVDFTRSSSSICSDKTPTSEIKPTFISSNCALIQEESIANTTYTTSSRRRISCVEGKNDNIDKELMHKSDKTKSIRGRQALSLEEIKQHISSLNLVQIKKTITKNGSLNISKLAGFTKFNRRTLMKWKKELRFYIKTLPLGQQELRSISPLRGELIQQPNKIALNPVENSQEDRLVKEEKEAVKTVISEENKSEKIYFKDIIEKYGDEETKAKVLNPVYRIKNTLLNQIKNIQKRELIETYLNSEKFTDNLCPDMEKLINKICQYEKAPLSDKSLLNFDINILELGIATKLDMGLLSFTKLN